MEPLINNALQLREFFHNIKHAPDHLQAAMYERGVNVSTQVRREVMLSDSQGRIVIGGKNLWLMFETRGGGVWKATVT